MTKANKEPVDTLKELKGFMAQVMDLFGHHITGPEPHVKSEVTGASAKYCLESFHFDKASFPC